MATAMAMASSTCGAPVAAAGAPAGDNAAILACCCPSVSITPIQVETDSPATGTGVSAMARSRSSPMRAATKAGALEAGSVASVRNEVKVSPAWGLCGARLAGRAASPWPTGVTARIKAKLLASQAALVVRSVAAKPCSRQRSEVVYSALPMSSHWLLIGWSMCTRPLSENGRFITGLAAAGHAGSKPGRTASRAANSSPRRLNLQKCESMCSSPAPSPCVTMVSSACSALARLVTAHTPGSGAIVASTWRAGSPRNTYASPRSATSACSDARSVAYSSPTVA